MAKTYQFKKSVKATESSKTANITLVGCHQECPNHRSHAANWWRCVWMFHRCGWTGY